MRIGHGFDVHKLESGRKLILGGVEIPYEKGLAGHSDADVILHAVVDAVLGALGKGDIGTHFPDSDPANKDLDSMKFLEKAVDLMHEAGLHLVNIDVTLHADKPKVKDYLPEMRENIARKFECNPQRVNVKATTWEGLGFTGRGEGMAASAVCLLFPDALEEDEMMFPFGTGHLYGDADFEEGKDSSSESKDKGVRISLTRKVDKEKAFVANIDGASKGNPGPASVGVVIRDHEGVVLAELSEKIGEATNNEAEYRSLIRALEECSFLKAEQVLVRTDSDLLLKQVSGKYKVKKEHLKKLFEEVAVAASGFAAFDMTRIPREDNKEADDLANAALRKKNN